MSIGSSGRIVLEIEPELKKELYSTLALDSMHMKQWFLKQVSIYLECRDQLPLELNNDEQQMAGGRK